MTTKSAPSQTLRLVSNNGFAEVWKNEISGQQSLHATKSFAPGDVICAFHAGTISSKVTYLTVQVDDHKHITLQPEFLQYINHSCEPTVFFDTTIMQLVCLAEINTGDEFSFFYPSTEWEMVQPFACYCGTSACLGTIQGAAHINGEILNQYRLTDFIKRKVKNRQQY
ncbi:MAG: SET domain-containing protein [Bacteroidota bacterium]